MRSAFVLCAVLVLSGGCRRGGGSAEHAGPPGVRVALTGRTPLPMTPAARRERATQSKKLYVAWCSGCHGEHGRGDGPASLVLDPKPRNFVVDKLKIRTTGRGQPASKQDVFDTVTRGLPGSAMPSFAFLSEEDRWRLVEHVRSLLGDDQKPDPTGTITLGAEPAATPEALARGQALYTKMGCIKCHGATGHGDGESAKDLKDDHGHAIRPRDLTTGLYIGGSSAAAVNMRLRVGMQGTPMPSFADSLSQQDGWDLAHYVTSLQQAKAPLPAELVARGRRVVQDHRCTACHVLEGQGGAVGPSLDVAARKLRYEFVKTWLRDPPGFGKIYPWIPYRMPNLKLSDDEIDGVLALFASLAQRSYPEPPPAAPVIDQARLANGQLIYFLKCTECHNMGTVVPTPEAKRQGPDLINVSRRIRADWLPIWVSNPQAVYPGTRMVNTNLTPEEIKDVAAFVWKTSVDAQAKAVSPAPGP